MVYLCMVNILVMLKWRLIMNIYQMLASKIVKIQFYLKSWQCLINITDKPHSSDIWHHFRAVSWRTADGSHGNDVISLHSTWRLSFNRKKKSTISIIFSRPWHIIQDKGMVYKFCSQFFSTNLYNIKFYLKNLENSIKMIKTLEKWVW